VRAGTRENVFRGPFLDIVASRGKMPRDYRYASLQHYDYQARFEALP
jgi:hypothetical protein